MLTPYNAAVVGTVFLLFPMGYFLLTSPTFLLVRLDVPQVSFLLRSQFSGYFMTVVGASLVSTLGFAFAGRPYFAVGAATIMVFSFLARRWFLRRIDGEIAARDAGDPGATTRLRRLHVGGMACNLVELGVVIAAVPSVFATPL